VEDAAWRTFSHQDAAGPAIAFSAADFDAAFAALFAQKIDGTQKRIDLDIDFLVIEPESYPLSFHRNHLSALLGQPKTS
jgi:hypothetical protein